MTEESAERRERCSERLREDAVALSNLRSFICTQGRRGPPTADSRFPSGFRHSVQSNSSLWIIQPRVDSLLCVPSQSSHPALGVWAKRKYTNWSLVTQAGWPGIGSHSWSLRGQRGLGAAGFVAAASPGSDSACQRDSLPHGENLD